MSSDIAQRNRSAMPKTAAIIDEFRAVFGQRCRVVWASENGREVGQRRPPERSMTGEQWLHYLKTGERQA